MHTGDFQICFPTKKALSIIITFATYISHVQHIRYIDPGLEHLRCYCTTTTIITVIIKHHDTYGREISMALSCHNRFI